MIVPPGPLPRGSSMATLPFHFGSSASNQVLGSWSGGTRFVLIAMVKMVIVRGLITPPAGTRPGIALLISAGWYASV